MQSVSDLLERLTSAGVTVAVDGPDIVLVPGVKVPFDLLPELKRRKPELLAWLEPSGAFGQDAQGDARILTRLIDKDPHTDLDAIRSRAAATGITGMRFAFALVALPERLNVPEPH